MTSKYVQTLAQHTNAPKGVAKPPAGVADGSDAFYDWLATQPQATREWYIEGRYNAIAGQKSVDPNDRKDMAHAEQDRLQAAQEKALAAGKQLPDVDAATGTGVHFSSDKQRAQYAKDQATFTAGKTQAESEKLTPDQVTVQPTQIPLDEQAAHPEQYVQHYGPAIQERAIAQGRTDTEGLQAEQASLADETAAINQGGLTAIDRARLEQARSQRAMQARAAEQAIMQRAEQQGRAGSPTQLLARQQSQQSAENQRSQDDLQTMALGLQRKDTLLAQRAGQGLSMQDAQDAIDKFNAEGARLTEQRNAAEANKRDTGNTDISNQALGAGMQYRTGLQASNTGITNQAEYANKGEGYGARSLVGTNMAARQPLINTELTSAGMSQDDQARKDAADAQNKALTWGTVGNLVGAGVNTAQAFVNPYKKS